MNERLNKIEERLTNIDNKIILIEKKQLTDWYELSDLITKAVEKGIEKVSKELEIAKKKIDVLEKAEGKRASLLLKTIITTVVTTTIGWIILGFLNNYASITSQAIKNSDSEKEVITNEKINNR